MFAVKVHRLKKAFFHVHYSLRPNGLRGIFVRTFGLYRVSGLGRLLAVARCARIMTVGRIVPTISRGFAHVEPLTAVGR